MFEKYDYDIGDRVFVCKMIIRNQDFTAYRVASRCRDALGKCWYSVEGYAKLMPQNSFLPAESGGEAEFQKKYPGAYTEIQATLAA